MGCWASLVGFFLDLRPSILFSFILEVYMLYLVRYMYVYGTALENALKHLIPPRRA